MMRLLQQRRGYSGPGLVRSLPGMRSVHYSSGSSSTQRHHVSARAGPDRLGECGTRGVAGQAHALLGCTFLFVLHHVNERSQWITNVETAHTPRFALGAVFNWQACFPDPCERYLDVINLD